jgi:hypothetical protein
VQLRLISSVLAVVTGLLIGTDDVRAQNRLALVVGINDYQNVFSLQKAVRDAKAIQDVLQRLGFQVSALFNANRRSFNAAISAFTARIQPGDVVLVHYSGHGVQLDGENFLLPADVPSPSVVDKEFLKSEAVALSVIIDRIKAEGARTAVFIIDACRNNPYGGQQPVAWAAREGLRRWHRPKGRLSCTPPARDSQRLIASLTTTANPHRYILARYAAKCLSRDWRLPILPGRYAMRSRLPPPE